MLAGFQSFSYYLQIKIVVQCHLTPQRILSERIPTYWIPITESRVAQYHLGIKNSWIPARFNFLMLEVFQSFYTTLYLAFAIQLLWCSQLGFYRLRFSRSVRQHWLTILIGRNELRYCHKRQVMKCQNIDGYRVIIVIRVISFSTEKPLISTSDFNQIMFVGNAGAYPIQEPFRCSTLG